MASLLHHHHTWKNKLTAAVGVVKVQYGQQHWLYLALVSIGLGVSMYTKVSKALKA
jgi:hypothetical protein